MWLADAARSVGGRLVSVDVDAARSALAAQNLDRAGLRELVELRVQDAAVSLREARDGAALDMIFLGCRTTGLCGLLAGSGARVEARSGLLAVDNVLSHADEVERLPRD